MARRALDALRVETRRTPDGKLVRGGDGEILRGWDANAVPLEYRDIVNTHIDTLLFYVHDEAAHKVAGTWDAVKELAEALAFVQVALTDRSSISTTTFQRRQGLRARAFADLLDHAERYLAPDDPFSAVSNPWRSVETERLERLIVDASEALGWFKTQDELNAAIRIRGDVARTIYPVDALVRMRAAIERLRAIARPASPESPA